MNVLQIRSCPGGAILGCVGRGTESMLAQYLMIKIISNNRKNDLENGGKVRESRKNVCVGEGKICGNRTRGYEKID